VSVDANAAARPTGKVGRRRLLFVAGAVLAAAAAAAAALYLSGIFRPYMFAGDVIAGSAPAPSLAPLVYENGEPVDIEARRGEVVLVYFGYTRCPDICPTTLSAAARGLELAGDPAAGVTLVMVTVDPERDTREAVGEYVRLFDERFRGAWGTEDQVRSVAGAYGVTFGPGESDETGAYWVNHSPQLMAIDREGVLRVVYPVGVDPTELASDLRELLG